MTNSLCQASSTQSSKVCVLDVVSARVHLQTLGKVGCLVLLLLFCWLLTVADGLQPFLQDKGLCSLGKESGPLQRQRFQLITLATSRPSLAPQIPTPHYSSLQTTSCKPLFVCLTRSLPWAISVSLPQFPTTIPSWILEIQLSCHGCCR